MATYRVVRRVLEEIYVDADDPEEAKSRAADEDGYAYDARIEAVEECGEEE